jgi:SAM-dependent methyltransferase
VTSFLRLDSGDPLDAADLRRLPVGATLVLRVVRPVAPLREGQIVHVRRCGPDQVCGLGLAVTADDGIVPVWMPGRASLARVTAIERGPFRLDLERPLTRYVPARWLPRLADILETAGRFTRPLTPPLFVGSPEVCLDRVRAKYSRTPEVRRYTTLAAGELERLELELITSAVPRGGRLLDVGCGAGREAMGLARAGYRVVGVDLSPAMVAAARDAAVRAGLAIDFRVKSLTELDEAPDTYDGAYIAAALHHVPGRARRVDALRHVRRALVPGGALILFVVYRWPRPWLSRSRLVDLIRRVAALLPLGLSLSEPGDGYMREVSDASDPRAPIFFHDYAGPDEVRGELESAGLVAHEARRGWWVCRRAAGAEPERCG